MVSFFKFELRIIRFIIIIIAGCVFHGCTKCFVSRDERENKRPYKEGRNMNELFAATCKRKRYIEKMGYTVVEMWECDLKRKLEIDFEMKDYFDSVKVRKY